MWWTAAITAAVHDDIVSATSAAICGGSRFIKFANMVPNLMNILLFCQCQVNFEREPRHSFLQLLGYDQNELSRKVSDATGNDVQVSEKSGVDASELAEKMALLNATVCTQRMYTFHLCGEEF